MTSEMKGLKRRWRHKVRSLWRLDLIIATHKINLGFDEKTENGLVRDISSVKNLDLCYYFGVEI